MSLDFLLTFLVCVFDTHPLATRGQEKKSENFYTNFDSKFKEWGRRGQTA